MDIKESFDNLKSKLFIPPQYRKWLSYSFFFLLVISMPIAVWGLTTGRFELRERAATFELIPTGIPIVENKIGVHLFKDDNHNELLDSNEVLATGLNMTIRACKLDQYNYACLPNFSYDLETLGNSMVVFHNLQEGTYDVWVYSNSSGWWPAQVSPIKVVSGGYDVNIPLSKTMYPPKPTRTPPTIYPTGVPSLAPTRSCAVYLDKSTYAEGQQISIIGNGNAYTTGTLGMNVWLERTDGKSIQAGTLNPWPTVSWLNKYYRLGTCNSSKKASCTISVPLFTVAPGQYNVFCDFNNTCSGGSGLPINSDINVGRCDAVNDRKILTIAAPTTKSCSVNISSVDTTISGGKTTSKINFSTVGNANILGTKGINLWLERQDGKGVQSGTLSPWPTVIWPPAPNTKYYRLGTCNSIGQTTCKINGSVTTTAGGDFYLFCDINNTCSGGSGLLINPDIDSMLGRCDSANDRKMVNAPGPVPFITPTPPMPTVIPQPTATPTRIMWEGFSPQIYHTTGQKEGASDWSANTAKNTIGYLNFGPYTTALKAGYRYRVTWTLLLDVRDSGFNDKVVIVEINDATNWKIIGQKQIYRNEFLRNWAYQDFSIDFTYQAGQKLEFRTYWLRRAYMKLDKITVTQLPLPAP